MGQRICRWESQVRLGREPDIREFRDHLPSCIECQESLAVRAWLQKFAALPLGGSSAPSARFLWLKGQMLRRWEQERRSTVSAERVQVSLGVAGAIALFAWLWRQLPTTALSDLPVLGVSGPDFSHALPAVLVLSLAVLIVTLSMAARDLVTQ
jgi:hypothetical protein